MQITVGELRQTVRESLEETSYNSLMNEGFTDKAKKFMKMLPLLTISLSTVACAKGPADHADEFNTDGFTEDEITVIEDAAAEICEKTGLRKCVTFGEEGDSTLKVAAQVTCDGNTPSPGHVFSGCNTHNPDTKVSNIVVKADRSNPEWLMKLHDTVQHELLHHVRGDKVHLPKGNRLAAAKEDQSAYVTDLDVKGL
jgi:hypothetical protein